MCDTPAVPGAEVAIRPRLRGALHGVGFFVAVGVGIAFVLAADGRAVAPAIVFAASAATMLGVSTLYHRITWTPVK